MPSPVTSAINLNAAKFLVGPKLIPLRGAADDFFVISQLSDVGAVQGGIQGDVLLVSRVQNAYTAAITVNQASAAIGTLLNLGALGTEFPVAIEYNDYTFNGWAIVMNTGDVAASLGTTTRTITLGLAYQSGNVNSGVGRVAGS